MRSRKAVSAVVATVLIILITVAAITIIWTAVIPMIRKSAEGGITCLDAQGQVSLVEAEGHTCITDNSVCSDVQYTTKADCEGALETWTVDFDLKVQVAHGAEEFDLEDVQVLVSSGGNTVTKTLMDDAIDSAGQDVDALDDLPGQNEEKVFTIKGLTAEPDKVSIAPIVKVGATQKTCSESAEVSPLSVCTS